MAVVGIFVGTVYGSALLVAEEAERILSEQGHQVKLFEEGGVSDWLHYQNQTILIVTSTTGQGDFPDSIDALYQEIVQSAEHYPALRYGLIALGDSSYLNFCRAGKRFDALLQEREAVRIGEVLYLDASVEFEPEVAAQLWLSNWGELLD